MPVNDFPADFCADMKARHPEDCRCPYCLTHWAWYALEHRGEPRYGPFSRREIHAKLLEMNLDGLWIERYEPAPEDVRARERVERVIE